MSRLLSRLDDASARVERGVVLVLLAVMSATVFFDVVHRVASTRDGLILKLLVALTGGDRTSPALREVGVPAVAGLIAYGFFYGALRTAAGERFDTRGRAAAGALGLLGLAVAALFGILTFFPNGLVWSQPLSLSLLLWVALLGSTLATKARGHIVLEVADKLWPAALLPFVRLGSGLLAAVFCGVLVALGLHFATDFYEQWREGVGYIPGLRLPKWVIFTSIPVCFAIMGARFLGLAVGDFLNRHAAPAHGESEVAS